MCECTNECSRLTIYFACVCASQFVRAVYTVRHTGQSDTSVLSRVFTRQPPSLSSTSSSSSSSPQSFCVNAYTLLFTFASYYCYCCCHIFFSFLFSIIDTSSKNPILSLFTLSSTVFFCSLPPPLIITY